MTFVRVKLLFEQMPTGSQCEVLLRGKEPLQNVPRSIEDHGHTILSLDELEPESGIFGIHKLIFIKN